MEVYYSKDQHEISCNKSSNYSPELGYSQSNLIRDWSRQETLVERRKLMKRIKLVSSDNLTECCLQPLKSTTASDKLHVSMLTDGATAATAMISLVRLILVILICVLLVKLRSPSSRKQRRKIDNNKDTQEISEQSGESTTRNLSNNWRARRSSQPELMSKSQAEQLKLEQQSERRRRHSDTSIAQLSLPPGPMGLPFLGYLPFVGNEIHLTLTSLSERYGPIYQIFLGGIRVVVLNDAALVRQAFKQAVFSGRPETQLTRILQGYGIVNSDGALWKEQRAFLHSTLRKLGAKSLMSGANGLEAKIQVSVTFTFLCATNCVSRKLISYSPRAMSVT